MTLSAAPALAGPFDGNGIAEEFSFDFKVFNVADLLVVKRDALAIESTLVLDVDYSVTLNGDQDADPGGVVLHPLTGAKLAAGERLTITTQLEVEQETDLTNLGLFFPQVVENMVDRVVALVRQLQSENVRAVRLPLSLADSDPTLPTPVAGAALVWNETGTAIVNGVATESLVSLSAYMANVIQAADAAEARSDLGAAADADVVKLAGAQTIADIKTFSAEPVIPVATLATSPVRKSQTEPAVLAPTLFVPATTVELTSGATATLSAAVPSWARELMVVLDSVSSNSTGNLSLTLGDSGGIETTGYSGLVLEQGSTTSSLSSGFTLTAVSVAAASWSGIVRFMRIDSGSNSYWVAESTLGRNDAATRPNEMIGRKQLSAALTTVVLNVGSGAFDGGRAQLFWR